MQPRNFDSRDEMLSIDLHIAIVLNAVCDLDDALNEFYVAAWQMCQGQDAIADKFYAKQRKAFLSLLDSTADLTVTDEFRKQYQDYKNGQKDD